MLLCDGTPGRCCFADDGLLPRLLPDLSVVATAIFSVLLLSSVEEEDSSSVATRQSRRPPAKGTPPMRTFGRSSDSIFNSRAVLGASRVLSATDLYPHCRTLAYSSMKN